MKFKRDSKAIAEVYYTNFARALSDYRNLPDVERTN